MAYELLVSELLDRKLKKLAKRGKAQLEAIAKKVAQIREDPHRFKPLRGSMAGIRRVHIEKSFVLSYEIDENAKVLRLLDYEHHDNAYQK